MRPDDCHDCDCTRSSGRSVALPGGFYDFHRFGLLLLCLFFRIVSGFLLDFVHRFRSGHSRKNRRSDDAYDSNASQDELQVSPEEDTCIHTPTQPFLKIKKKKRPYDLLLMIRLIIHAMIAQHTIKSANVSINAAPPNIAMSNAITPTITSIVVSIASSIIISYLLHKGDCKICEETKSLRFLLDSSREQLLL